MKKCPNCGAQIIDDSLFCTECGKPIPQGNVCPHCGASVNEGDVFCQCCGKRVDESPSLEMTDSMQKKCPHCDSPINDGDTFCQSCGKRLDESLSPVMTDSTQKKCPHCNSLINDDDAFCQSCGTPLNGIPTQHSTPSYDEVEPPTDYKKIIIPIVIGLIVLALIGGGWYGYKEYSAYTEKKLAREKFVADSLGQVRKDSIKLAEQKEKEELEAKRHEEFKEKFTFTNILNLLENYDNVTSAKKCGFSLIYRDFEDGGGEDIDCLEIVYGYDVEKGGKSNYGYEIISKSNYACYLKYNLDSSTYASLHFKDSSDADFFQKQAKEYGMLVYENSMFVPKKKMSSGYHYVDSLDWGGEYDPIYAIGRTESENGWYTVSIGIDF